MTDDDEFTDDEITGPIEVKRHGPDKPRTVYTIHPNARPFGIPAPDPEIDRLMALARMPFRKPEGGK